MHEIYESAGHGGKSALRGTSQKSQYQCTHQSLRPTRVSHDRRIHCVGISQRNPRVTRFTGTHGRRGQIVTDDELRMLGSQSAAASLNCTRSTLHTVVRFAFMGRVGRTFR